MDPAAFGTAMIGLEAIRQAGTATPPGGMGPPRRGRRAERVRRQLATALRGIATRIEPARAPAG